MAKLSDEVAAIAYTPEQAAAALTLAPAVVRALIERGDIPSVRIGDRIVISKTGLHDWLIANTGRSFDGVHAKPVAS